MDHITKLHTIIYNKSYTCYYAGSFLVEDTYPAGRTVLGGNLSWEHSRTSVHGGQTFVCHGNCHHIRNQGEDHLRNTGNLGPYDQESYGHSYGPLSLNDLDQHAHDQCVLYLGPDPVVGDSLYIYYI